MKHICFLSPTKVTLEGKSLTKFDIAFLIDKVRIFGYTNPDYYTKPELISLFRKTLSTYPNRVQRLGFAWI